jgi:hypothetical protein
MSRRTAVRFALCSLAGIGPFRGALAQDAYVYYDHRPGAAGLDGRLSYIRSGGDQTDRQLGRPPALSVPNGSQVCIQVTSRNDVLYTYAIGVKNVAADTIPGLAALVKQLTDALAIPHPLAVTDGYLTTVAHLYERLLELQVAQLGSDSIADIAASAAGVASLFANATEANNAANTAFADLGGANSSPPARLLRLVQTDLWQRITAINARFQRARQTADDPLCTKVGSSRLRITLKIARSTVDSAGRPQRPVGDTVVTLDVHPQDNRLVIVEPGTIVSVFTQEKSSFGVSGGVVTQTRDRSPGLHAGVLAMFRAGSIDWLYLTLGVGTAEKSVADVLLGVTMRGGASLVGGRLSIGVGLALSRVPVGLSQGTVGGALPATTKNVNDIVKRDFRAGLAVSFALNVS